MVQRIAGQHMGFFAFNGLRFVLGALVLAPFAYRNWKWLKVRSNSDGVLSVRTILFPLVSGSILFIAAAFQQAGLEQTTAGNAGFITTLYVVIVPFLLSLFWKHRIPWIIWVASVCAVAGAGLLSTGGASFQPAPGDSLEFIGAIFWALHVIVVGLAVKEISALRFSVAQYLIAGVMNLIAGIVYEGNLMAGSSEAWWTILYIGLISTALGYTLQAVGQRHAPPSDAALILSLEAVFSAFFGWLILGELLGPMQLLGCGLIFSGVILAQRRQPGEEMP